jgi:hypothetical protein
MFVSEGWSDVRKRLQLVQALRISDPGGPESRSALHPDHLVPSHGGIRAPQGRAAAPHRELVVLRPHDRCVSAQEHESHGSRHGAPWGAPTIRFRCKHPAALQAPPEPSPDLRRYQLRNAGRGAARRSSAGPFSPSGCSGARKGLSWDATSTMIQIANLRASMRTKTRPPPFLLSGMDR